MSSDDKVEKMIKEKGLEAPRLTPSEIDSRIVDVKYHVFEGTCLTVCCLTLENGFTVSGESACASPENFDPYVGENIAFENAKNKIWMLEGYLLKERLHNKSKDFLGRMLDEQGELLEKCIKLDQFIGTEKFKSLDDTNKDLLKRQRSSMKTYYEIISERISLEEAART